MSKSSSSSKPVCSKCGATGHGVQFKIFSKYGFGTFCVPCEDKLEIATSQRTKGELR